LDDIIRTTYQSFQALSVNCARCHDHKFDPITRKDYYKTIAVFNGFVEYDHPLVPPEEWDRYQKSANEINGKIKILRDQVAAIEAPYQRTLSKDPRHISRRHSRSLQHSRREAHPRAETPRRTGGNGARR
jgi:hypothetical protein